MVMAWIGDAVCMAAASALPICIQDPTPAVGSPHNGTWVAFRAISDEITTFKGVVTMCRNVTKRQCSSTQTATRNLSATTLTTEQMPSHQHGTPHWLAQDMSEIMTSGGFLIAGTNRSFLVSTSWTSNATGGSTSHTHGITNPTHVHEATSTTLSTYQPSRTLYMIMRTA